MVNGRLVDNPSSKFWRETGEVHLKQGLLENCHTRKSSAAVCLSGVQKQFSDGISDWARKWELPQDYSVSDDCDHDYKKSSPIMMPAAELVTLGAEPTTAAATAPTITGNVPLIICLTICYFLYLLLHVNTVSPQNVTCHQGNKFVHPEPSVIVTNTLTVTM